MRHSIEYSNENKCATYNGVKFTRDERTGYYLSTTAVKGRRVRLHRYVWEIETGDKIPKGFDVHHIDKNKENNDISNLALLSRSDHQSQHQHIMSEEELEKRSKRVATKMLPKAIEWHKSKEGREWHKKHGTEVIKNLSPAKYVCTYCGREFETKNRYSKTSNSFCSNNCRAAYRRQSGVDNVERMCKKCGQPFIANKYSKAKYCEQHRHKNR